MLTPYVLQFLLFSLVSAFCLLAGFGNANQCQRHHGTFGIRHVSALMRHVALCSWQSGFLIKAGAVGVHVWLPGAYAEADDDLLVMLSAVISKVAIFGLFMVTYPRHSLRRRARNGACDGLDRTSHDHSRRCDGFQQTDLKQMLGYSSMSQIGYIITAIALMSHLVGSQPLPRCQPPDGQRRPVSCSAAVILRTGTRLFDETGDWPE